MFGLFKKKPPAADATPKNNPHLFQEKRKHLRYQFVNDQGKIAPIPEVSLLIKVNSKFTKRNVTGLGFSGLGFEPADDDTSSLKTNDTLETELHIRDKIISLKLNIRYCHAKMVGAKIIEIQNDDLSLLDNFLAPKCAGYYLRPVSPKYIKQTSEDTTTHWFRGERNSEVLIIYSKSDEIVSYQIKLINYLLIGNKTGVTTTGRLKDSFSDNIGYTANETSSSHDHTVNIQTLYLTREMLQSAHLIEKRLLTPILNHIEEAIKQKG